MPTTRQGSARRQPDVEDSPLTDAPSTPTSSMSSAARSLEERIQVAKAQRDLLLKEQELRQLEEHIELLRKTTLGPTIIVSSEQSQASDDASHSSRKRSASDSQEYSHAKRSMRPKDPDLYRGSHLKEHKEFCRSCENAFRLTPENFQSEREKVVWAMQYLKGDPREAWYSHWERLPDTSIVTWKAFVKFLLDLLSDPVNRTLEAATQLAKAAQRMGQSIRSFATYLETLEDQLPPYSEEHRVQHLYSKLRPELQTAITNYHQVPRTREELVVLGATLERNQQKAGAPSAPQGRRAARAAGQGRPSSSMGKAPEQREKRYERPERRSGDSRSRDLASVECWKCHIKGHYATQCDQSTRTKNPNKMEVPARAHLVGKGRAS
ncbi:hypothetical protein MBLNU459_g1090t1 [Dothideomycetes sp. NU459]